MKKPSSGFTLVEIVIAISILTLVMGTAYSTLTQIIGVKRLLDDKRDTSVTAYAIILRLTRELQLTAKGEQLIFADDKSSASDNNLSGVYLLGESQGSDSKDKDSITFVAQEGGQYLPDGGTHTGLVQITYKVLKDPENQGDTFSLVREEIPYSKLPNTNDSKEWQLAKSKAFQQQIVFPITDNLVSLRLSYYDAMEEKWINEWNADKKGNVPALVYFSVRLKSPLGKIEEYSTTVPIGAWARKVS